MIPYDVAKLGRMRAQLETKVAAKTGVGKAAIEINQDIAALRRASPSEPEIAELEERLRAMQAEERRLDAEIRPLQQLVKACSDWAGLSVSRG